jgi:ribosomal protein S18 acetylase RimI-like enzyme
VNVTGIRALAAPASTVRDRLLALVADFPDWHVHVIDAMYRLTSPALDDPSSARVWQSAAGDIVGFGIWQPAFKMFDYGFHPHANREQVAATILDWGIEAFERRVREQPRPHTFWIKVLTRNVVWRDAVESRRFSRCAWSIAHMETSLAAQIPSSIGPEGFQIRPAAGDEEAEGWAALHRAVFPRAGMTTAWRLEMTRTASYRRDLDLVVAAPDGTLAAFCQGWVASIDAALVGEIEPYGTHPAYRQRRLGRAVLAEMMRRMQAARVERLFGEPWDDNAAAVHSYRSLGFMPTFTIPTYARTFS